MLPLVAPLVYLLLIMRNAGLKETIAVAGCGWRRRRAVHISHSSLAGLQHRSLSAAQLQDETRVLPSRTSHWNHERPKNYFPLFTQHLCQHVTVVCAAALRSRWFPNGDGTARFKRPSTRSRDVRFALTTLGAPMKPS